MNRQVMVDQARNHAMVAEDQLARAADATPTEAAILAATAQAHATLAAFWLNSAWEEDRAS